MKLSKYFRDIICLAFIGASLSGAYFLSQKITYPVIVISKQQSSLNLNTNFLNYLNFGQKRFYSSLFWISTILEADQEHYKSRNLNSWMFLRFKTISQLEPKFYETYNFGTLYLSIIKDDISGASYLYSKGLEIYPNDFYILKNASFHYYYEAQNYLKANAVLNRLKKHPKTTPIMLATLARIETQNGNAEDAFQILMDAYNSVKDKDNFLAQKIGSYLYAIKSEKDLHCLNLKKSNCDILDFEGNPYKLVGKEYKALKKWEPFRINKKK
jgi:hypothetical protein